MIVTLTPRILSPVPGSRPGWRLMGCSSNFLTRKKPNITNARRNRKKGLSRGRVSLTTKPTIRIGGFFSGIGSHISACQRLADRANFVYVFQCEFDERTAKANNVLHGDIPNLGDITTVDNIGGVLAVDILYWTPPCQDISNAGKMAGNAKGSGTRSALAYEVPRIIANTPESDRPKYLVMEEVPMMISRKFKDNFADLLGELSALGYRHEYGILNACDCGVAQSRRRVFVISKLNSPAPKLPAPIPLTKCLKDYLEPEPVDKSYYLSEERLKGLIWSNEKEAEAGNNYRFAPIDATHTHTQ